MSFVPAGEDLRDLETQDRRVPTELPVPDLDVDLDESGEILDARDDPETVDVHDMGLVEVVDAHEVDIDTCGDEECQSDENCQTCPDDCGGSCCGQGGCQAEFGEDPCTCPEDCGSPCEGKECGYDGCQGACGECPDLSGCDAGTCIYVPNCGDGECAPEETSGSCPVDCYTDVTDGFVVISAGTFWMGSPGGEPCPEGYPGGGCDATGTGNTIEEPFRNSNETLHKVMLTRHFEMQIYEVTQGEWNQAFDGWNPSHFDYLGDAYPVENVSWEEAAAYANWMSEQAGLQPCYEFSDMNCWSIAGPEDDSDYRFCMRKWYGGILSATVTVVDGASTPYDCEGYRLPTEAEWEYAARAGSSTAIYPSEGNDGSISDSSMYCAWDSNVHEIAVYCANSSDHPEPPGTKAPNAWGLFDMSGNVEEFCWDRYCHYDTNDWVDPYGEGCSEYANRTARGGGWDGVPKWCRSADRYAQTVGYWSTGFRLVRTITP